MKRPLTISLVIALFFCQFGYYMLHLYRRAGMKEAFEQQLRSGNIHSSLLTLIETDANNSQFRWEKQGKECWWNGNIYDVVKIDTVAGKLVITALRDEAEKELLKEFANNLEKDLGNKSGQSFRNLVPFFETDIPARQVEISLPDNADPMLRGPLYAAALLFAPHRVQTPPPKA